MPRLDSDRCSIFSPTFSDLECLYYDAAHKSSICGYCKKPNYSYRCIADTYGSIQLSHSTVQDFITCHHLLYLKHFRGIQIKNAAVSSPIKCGKLWDTVMNKYLGGTEPNGKPIDISAVIDDYEIENRDIAKVKAMYLAYKELEIQTDPNAAIQSKINLKIPFGKVWADNSPVELTVSGYYDRKYEDYFVENKLSGRPDHYLDLFFIQSQVGTYFLADPNLQSCVMEIARTPDLKQQKQTKKRDEESDEDFQQRCFQDILSRPSHYFIGYDREKRTYGKRFWRKEFDLDEIKNRYLYVFKEIYEARIHNGFYKNDRACAQILPGVPCEMLNVCRYNTMSETVYQIKKRQSF